MDEVSRRHLFSLLTGTTAGLAGCKKLVNLGSQMPTETPTSTGATRTVETTSQLEAAFDTLSPGDTIQITAANAPYRTTQWLDIDVNGVTVIGPDINHLIKPGRRANVGGIRIGHNSHCENINVHGIGYHGNPVQQSDNVKWLHGIVVKDAANVILSKNYITLTHPYHEHGSGGSGISVETDARYVRVFNNRIHDIGDRGIQLAGDGITVAGNVVTKGLDRSISCDLWRAGTNYQASNVSITNNVMGNNMEGSLSGIGGGHPTRGEPGYITISNNVGFGQHKSFCHLGFDGRIKSVQVEGNMSVQEGTKTFAGISVEIDNAINISIQDNDLYQYNGRGVNIERGTSDFTVAGNRLYNTSHRGIRIAGATDGTVTDNHVRGAGNVGIDLGNGAQHVTVESNQVRDVARAGIVTRGGANNHIILGNSITDYGQGKNRNPPAILIKSTNNVVRQNHIYQNGGPAIVETDEAGNNTYIGNWADGTTPWKISSPTSTFKLHTPPFDSHHGVDTASGGSTVTIMFEKPYQKPPRLVFGRGSGGLPNFAYKMNEEGHYIGAEISTDSTDDVIDVAAKQL